MTAPRLELISRLPDGPARPTPLLFVHGAYTSAWCWDWYFLPYFASKGYAAHALSLRGHGHSAGWDELSLSSLDDFVSDVAHTVERFERPPVLIGHSMGGFIVAEHLRRGDAPAAVLMASVPPEGLLGSAFGLVAQNPDFFNEINIIHHVDPRFATMESARQALFSEGVAEEVLERAFAHMQPESQRAIYDLSWPWFRGPWRLNGTPALVLGAQKDAFFPPHMVDATAWACRTTAEIFPDMAHAMMLEPGWRKVADRIVRWLDDLGI